MSKLVKPISEETNHDWVIEIDGQPVKAKHVTFNNSKFGLLSFGQRPEGTIGWIWHEASGGGQGVVPYSVIDDLLFIGLVQESRPMLSGLAWNIPRGFINPGETHFDSAKRELGEEVGNLSWLELKELQGLPANPNSTFFDTSSRGGDFRFFGLEIPAVILTPNIDVIKFGDGLFCKGSYKFKDDSIKSISRAGEKIIRCLFFPWPYASIIQDTFTGMGVLRLLTTNRHLINYL